MRIHTDVLIVGGGFAGATAAQELQKQGVSTILIDRKDYFEVTFATLREIAAPDKTGNRARKKYEEFLSGKFIQSDVTSMTTNSTILSDGTEITFKHGVIASGSRYSSMPIAKSNEAMTIKERNSELANFHQQLKGAKNALILGGGVVGVELAGEIAHAMPHVKVTLAHNGNALLNGYKPKAQKKALEQLNNIGVNVIFNSQYVETDDRYVDQNTGNVINADAVYQATGVLPNNEYLQEHLQHILNDHGFVKVSERLEVVGERTLYALGDIADVGEAKLGYLAQEQGRYLAKALVKKTKGKNIKPYKRKSLMALIPIGQRDGVVQLPFAVTTLRSLVGMKQKDLFINKVYSSF